MKQQKLTQKEQRYYDMMIPKSGVMYLMGRPGEGKTATIECIAEKMGYQYIDLRLSQMDETDIGLYPKCKEDGGVEYVKHIVPEWAHLANQKKTIIVFEELNRARESIRNAALQILNERRVGFKFKFNDDVLMCATGNLGEEDGTSVDEFDSALWNRLLPVKHSLTIEEWCDGYANDHVYPHIINFIKANPNHFYTTPSETSKQYATPRSWTFLSNRLKTCETLNEAIVICEDCGNSYIGTSATTFVRYLHDQNTLNIHDIVKNYDKNIDKIKALTRDKRSELLTALKEIKFSGIKNKVHVNNIIKFLKDIHDDERMSYIIHIIDVEIADLKKKNDNVQLLFDNFKEDIKYVRSQHNAE
jgi:hypothetical protein